MNTEDDDILDDVRVDYSTYSRLNSEVSLLLKAQLSGKNKRETKETIVEEVTEVNKETTKVEVKEVKFDPKVEFEDRFSRPRRLDIGSGNRREPAWISLDINENYHPHLKMDARAMLLNDGTVDEARALYSLSCIENPELVLQETWRVLVPGATLTVVEGMPGSDLTLFPGVKHSFTVDFWKCVTDINFQNYVPIGAKGRWSLATYKYTLNNIGQKLCWKFKFTWDETVNTFRNVAQQQLVVLKKTMF
jgi:hypothetical protein